MGLRAHLCSRIDSLNTCLFYLGVVLGVVSAICRLFSYYHAALLDGEIVIPMADPDVFYHMKRITHLFRGAGDILFRDHELNYPCGFVPPWPWGFDSLMSSVLRVVNIAGEPTDNVLFAQASMMVVIIGGLQVLVIYTLMRRCGANRWVALLSAWAVSFSIPFLEDAHFGAVDNQIADTMLAVGVPLLISSEVFRRRSTLSAVALVLSMSLSDVAVLLAVLLEVGYALALLLGWREHVSSGRPFFYKVALGTVLFLSLEHLVGLERSYGGVRFLIVEGIAIVSFFAFLIERRAMVSPPARWMLASALVALEAVTAAFSQLPALARFFVGQDGISEQIVEATPAWRYHPWYLYLLVSAGTALGCAAVMRCPVQRLFRLQFCLVAVVGFSLFSMQVKFSFMVLAPCALGVAWLATRLVSSAAVAPPREYVVTLFSVVFVVLVSLSCFYRGVGYRETPTELTRTVYALASALNAAKDGPDCGVITAPSFGAAINYLTGCRVSASTFWGDPCSKKAYQASVRACLGDHRPVEMFRDRMRYRYFMVEFPSREKALINSLRPSTVFSREYLSPRNAAPFVMVLLDLDRRPARP